MEKVYLLNKIDETDVDNCYCLGVYTSKELAEQALNLYLDEWARNDDKERRAIKQELNIKTMKLDVAPPSWNVLVKNKWGRILENFSKTLDKIDKGMI